ncbi:pyridoxamine 5'-phosphate oxidase [Streptomyces alfalfae]|uniref:Pyridoxamine 5'-phosphate oxidase n=1 Tax=Streptomyces alfalfae TaxID=1642299 RepID=A0A1P8TGL2_9ACTN|nr:pyridoxamine 5'-phosphate oxidase family protein [Streptomyces alfalfae]AYA17189.1 pyridoxamine 5'-phosphate oxidase family protein [Streptomyces fradiae]APY86802.1 pyridoxamine 5'-phosphate oxidase [Streptomyces alfalfae]QQC90943.1 pyridoxamine 5'-phosphate oxidase family protein [Streptomyces alfalfae]QUI33429.1 pyridoxamine 5'-phosphate oxidase family protein [Streptomyces alfalfae]RXX37913.1 pyridoxamine 5'-phosphate oxidase [Streptomyces alfalfae]
MSFNRKDLGTAESAAWGAFVAAEPEFAATVQSRFDAFVHHTLATLRKDGSPRTTGLEVRFLHDELWLGMMPGSLKALDLRRDPRFALQANLGPEAEMTDGDVRIAGRAVEVRDPQVIAGYADVVQPPDADAFHLFRTELTEVVRTYIEDGKYLAVQLWKPGAALRTTRRT